jgi:DNA-binding response OmpR family regulator
MNTTRPHITPNTKTVLILEDDQDIRDTIVDMLEIMGFKHMSAVDSLEEARLLVQGFIYDIIVSDCNLGEGPEQENGRHFLEEVARNAPNSARLFISANRDNFAGFEGETLTKPFTLDPFKCALNRALIASGQEPISLG